MAATARRASRAAAPAPPRPRTEAALALVADAAPGAAAERVRWLRRVLAAWGVARTFVWITLESPLDPTVLGVSLVALLAALGLAWAPRFETLATRVALPALVAQLALTLPLTANHFFLELYATVLLALADREGTANELVLAGLRWLAVIVLFLTGGQKLAFGHYWHGDFLAFMVGRGDRFADLFAWVLPADEVARLQSYDPFRGSAGPYRVTSLPFVAMSNVVWIAEILLPIGLVLRRTRAAAAAAAMLFVLVLQLGAREMGFAVLFVNLLALFAPPRIARGLALASSLALAAVAVAALGVPPGRALLRAWHLW